MPRGFTLAELLLALLLVAILSAVAVPQLAGPLDAYAVGGAARRVAGAHVRARLTALSTSRITLLTISPDTIAVQVLDGQDTLLIWQDAGPIADRVLLTGPRRALTFAPNGWAFGFANATYHLTRGAAQRDVIVSRLGRVRIVP